MKRFLLFVPLVQAVVGCAGDHALGVRIDDDGEAYLVRFRVADLATGSP